MHSGKSTKSDNDTLVSAFEAHMNKVKVDYNADYISTDAAAAVKGFTDLADKSYTEQEAFKKDDWDALRKKMALQCQIGLTKYKTYATDIAASISATTDKADVDTAIGQDWEKVLAMTLSTGSTKPSLAANLLTWGASVRNTLKASGTVYTDWKDLRDNIVLIGDMKKTDKTANMYPAKNIDTDD